MSEVNLTVHPFRMGTDKEAALKALEEVFGAWQSLEGSTCGGRFERDDELLPFLADEIADCIQACCNLADRYDIDLQAALNRVEAKNRERGRYE